ncbi:MAG: hypothetical protein ACTSR8_17125 [Promethearchaeota archaeon]
MNLQPLDYLNGSLSIIVVVISFYVGIHIVSKYFEIKKTVFLKVGIVAICTSEPWWPHVISFILALINTKLSIPEEIYFILGNVLIPLAIALWLSALADLLYDEKKKLLLITGLIYAAIYEIIFFSFLFANPALIGIRIGLIDVQYNIILLALLTTALLIILLTGLRFSQESLKSDASELKMKGKFLSIAFISYCTGAAIDALILSNVLNLTIARLLLVIAAFGFLGGFVPPDWMKKIFLKETNQIS